MVEEAESSNNTSSFKVELGRKRLIVGIALKNAHLDLEGGVRNTFDVFNYSLGVAWSVHGGGILILLIRLAIDANANSDVRETVDNRHLFKCRVVSYARWKYLCVQKKSATYVRENLEVLAGTMNAEKMARER